MTAITTALTNSGTTAGFKSCILRDADAGHFVTISLFPSSVTYSSPSGNDTNNPILQLPNATGKTLLAVPQYA